MGRSMAKKKSPDFRENPARCIYINGEINQSLIDRLTPQINNLRLAESAPITVYIDSVGGETPTADVLLGLLKTPNQDGEICRIITVATGMAASAAADLLARGDYAIAYPHSQIHHHGVRSLPSQLVTTEYATNLASFLKSRNEYFALDLAERSLPRFFFRYFNVKSEFAQIRQMYGLPDMADVECMAEVMKWRLPRHRALPEEALRKHQRLNALTGFYTKRLQTTKKKFKRPADREAFLLNCLVEYELKQNKEETWQFSAGGLAEMQEDFTLLSDYESGQHMQNLETQVTRWGWSVLTEEQNKVYAALKGGDADKWLIENTREHFRTLWHFLVSICRALQEGEHRLTATESYWFGLIDEVSGSSLPCLRRLFETEEDPKPTAIDEASSAPQLPNGTAPEEAEPAPKLAEEEAAKTIA
jgi:ATP-dependent protease ClpP protease subunit